MNALKKTVKIIKKYWITFWMLIAILAVTGLIVYARYNDNRNVVKRVVSTQKGDRTLFSSNLLSASVSQQIKTVAVNETNSQFFDISIYDYDIRNPGTEYPTDIDYDLTVTFYNSAGTTALTAEEIGTLLGTDSVNLYNFDGNTTTTEATPFLTVDKDTVAANRTVRRVVTRTTKVDSFRMFLPISMKDKDVSVKVTAAPSGYTDLPESIGAVFSIRAQAFTAINGWHGDFNDDRTIPLSQYDGFNYSITGNGVSEGILSWNNTLVEPNMQQINQIKKSGATVTTTGTTSSIVLSLDSTDNAGHYDIQFYVVSTGSGTGRTTIDSMTWPVFADQATGTVTFVETTSP